MRRLEVAAAAILSILVSRPIAGSESVAFEINVFQGFGMSAPVTPRSSLVFYPPPAEGWPAEIAGQRKALVKALQLTGAAFLEGRRSVIAFGGQERIDPLRGRILVALSPLRASTEFVEYQLAITCGTGDEAVTASAAVSTELGRTTVVGASGVGVPDGWEAPGLPLLVAITARRALLEPSILPVSGDVTAPEELSRVQPGYPPELKEQGVGGTVVVDIIISAEGTVTATEIAHRAHPALEEAALQAIRQWKYRPAH